MRVLLTHEFEQGDSQNNAGCCSMTIIWTAFTRYQDSWYTSSEFQPSLGPVFLVWVYRLLENSFFQFTKLFLDLDSIIFFRFFQQPMNQCNNIARLVFRLFIMPIILDIMPKYFITEYFITKYILALGLYAWWWY